MGRFRNAEHESGRRRSRNEDHEADGPEESISDENTNASSSATTSDIKRTRRDEKSKGKHKFSIHFQTQNKVIYCHDLVDDENIELYDISEEIIQQNVKDKNSNHSITELLHEVKHQNATQKDDQISRKLTVPDTSDRHSISMLLEDLQDSDGGFEMLDGKALPNKKSCGGKTVIAGEKLSSLLGERLLDNEDNFENIDTEFQVMMRIRISSETSYAMQPKKSKGK